MHLASRWLPASSFAIHPVNIHPARSTNRAAVALYKTLQALGGQAVEKHHEHRWPPHLPSQHPIVQPESEQSSGLAHSKSNTFMMPWTPVRPPGTRYKANGRIHAMLVIKLRLLAPPSHGQLSRRFDVMRESDIIHDPKTLGILPGLRLTSRESGPSPPWPTPCETNGASTALPKGRSRSESREGYGWN
ncbi:hypothetical protein THAOC_18223 [Thalassiosira oceanica]|uniref:Uncharacterized protein n=1 Tax=Thalassiosira oceanica TaxID=159749 RepID=K0S8R0_THAOC|nr:hypothetical protein THAOC_18223 [Thalassiosira oceanica]|eukprot:EJK61319.1 hypothetical protein THAOC_18223 [Thalassiosira oceanica]